MWEGRTNRPRRCLALERITRRGLESVEYHTNQRLVTEWRQSTK